MKSANLCWGQRYIWLRHHQVPPHARHESHVVLRFDMPAGVTPVMVRSTLDYLVRRHEALRTTYHLDDEGVPQQRVHPPAAVPLVRATVERDGTPTPAEVVERLASSAFDLAAEWSLRACLITRDGAPAQVVLVLNHMAFDAWTIDRFEREFEALGAGLAARRPAVLDPVLRQPADLAAHESSAEASAAKDVALAHWRDEIAGLVPDVFATRRGAPAGTVARAATLTSPAMLEASRRVAERHKVWPSLVHVAVYTAVMAAYTGSAEVSHLSFTGNRGATPFRDVMTCLFSPLLMRVDCHDDPPFPVLVERVAERSRLGQRHADVPYDELLELLSREGSRRGEVLRTGSELNFLNHGDHATRAKRTKFTWNPTPAAWAEYGADTYFRVLEFQDAAVIGLNAASTVMDADAVERFLRGYEAVLLAVDGPAADLTVADAADLCGFAAPGTVSSPTPLAAQPPAVQALLAAVSRVNGLGEASPDDGYVTAGGRVLRIPHLLADLAERGWAGASLHDLAGGLPLRDVAARLTAVS